MSTGVVAARLSPGIAPSVHSRHACVNSLGTLCLPDRRRPLPMRIKVGVAVAGVAAMAIGWAGQTVAEAAGLMVATGGLYLATYLMHLLALTAVARGVPRKQRAAEVKVRVMGHFMRGLLRVIFHLLELLHRLSYVAPELARPAGGCPAADAVEIPPPKASPCSLGISSLLAAPRPGPASTWASIPQVLPAAA